MLCRNNKQHRDAYCLINWQIAVRKFHKIKAKLPQHITSLDGQQKPVLESAEFLNDSKTLELWSSNILLPIVYLNNRKSVRYLGVSWGLKLKFLTVLWNRKLVSFLNLRPMFLWHTDTVWTHTKEKRFFWWTFNDLPAKERTIRMYVHRFAVIWKRCRKKFNFRKNYKYAEFSFFVAFLVLAWWVGHRLPVCKHARNLFTHREESHDSTGTTTGHIGRLW